MLLFCFSMIIHSFHHIFLISISLLLLPTLSLLCLQHTKWHLSDATWHNEAFVVWISAGRLHVYEENYLETDLLISVLFKSTFLLRCVKILFAASWYFCDFIFGLAGLCMIIKNTYTKSTVPHSSPKWWTSKVNDPFVSLTNYMWYLQKKPLSTSSS